MAIHQFTQEQFIKAPLNEVWDFISSPHNLQKITPPSMGFKVKTNVPDKMYPGLMIGYTVKPLLGIPVSWLTEITHVEERKYFVDEQRSGPYAIWHHEHFLEETDGGVLMKDIITYKAPLGWFGVLMNVLVIRNKLNSIFKYRRSVIETIWV